MQKSLEIIDFQDFLLHSLGAIYSGM